MKVRELMSNPVVRIHADEPITVAARTLTRYNIGAMPVCGSDGRICGVITVREVMTGQVLSVTPDTEARDAAALMARCQVRRLPVVQNGRLCGIVSLGDLAHNKIEDDLAGDTLTAITDNISRR